MRKPPVWNGPTRNMLLPVLSNRQSLSTKGFLAPALVTVVAVVGMFAALGSPTRFMLILALYIGAGGYWAIYRFCGKAHPWWFAPVIAIATIIVVNLLV